MTDRDFTTSFFVDQSPEQAFAAIKNVRGWWSEGVHGGTEALGDEFTYRYRDIHYSRQKLVELVPSQKLVWLVLEDAYLELVQDKNEWSGTRLCFEIFREQERTVVRFTHEGLVRERECFGVCSEAWSFYIGSLRELIATGVGQPDPAPERAA